MDSIAKTKYTKEVIEIWGGGESGFQGVLTHRTHKAGTYVQMA